jgi:4-amino-4-deoxy-L-arabinose transferase-like glycosyltransferase
MPALKSSAPSRRSNLAGVVLLLTALSAAAVGWCAAHGYTLYYGDAEAHLNIARRVIDSRTPGPEQLGTVWLPLPHILMLPFVAREQWWRSGIAGAIPSALGFIAAGAFLYAAARRLYASAAAALAAALLFALNPNMLYLQATPMTEAIFAAALAALLWSTVVFRDTQSGWAVLAAAAASNAASLTRYEGWFLIPFVALYLLLTARRKSYALVFAVLAALGPLAWLAHNQYYYSNALEFYDGDFSAQAIYARQVAAGVARYPGDHNWSQAIHYYFTAVTLTQGWILVALTALGAVAALAKKLWWPLLLLALPPAFYVWSMHSSGTPLYLPTLWPHSWYNTRYALAALPVAALAAAGVVAMLPAKLHALGAAVLIVAVAASWALAGTPLCWKESAVNSQARRVWTGQAAAYLAAHYQEGDGIIYSFGDLTGVLREAGIPLREGLHQGNRPSWDAAVLRPDLFFHEEWALAVAGDKVDQAVNRLGPRYELKKRIMVEGAPAVEIYERQWKQIP